MQAANVMTATVIAVKPDTGVRDVAHLLLKHRISAVPVVDDDLRVLGIVSEGDLMRRAENDTESQHSWWLEAFLSTQDRAGEYIKTHGRTAGDVMTRHVVTVVKETPLYEIAQLLEKHHIKRVPVVDDEKLVGIVSRANLLHGLAAKGAEAVNPSSVDDQAIRERLLNVLSEDAGLDTVLMNVIVKDGVVQLWGLVSSSNEKKAAQLAAETMSGVKAVENHLGQVPPWVAAY